VGKEKLLGYIIMIGGIFFSLGGVILSGVSGWITDV
jgi:hypothetical protein